MLVEVNSAENGEVQVLLHKDMPAEYGSIVGSVQGGPPYGVIVAPNATIADLEQSAPDYGALITPGGPSE